MRKVHIKYFHSYEEADNDMLNEYLSMPPKSKVAAVNEIRRKIFSLKGVNANNRVQRVISFGRR